MEEDVSSRSRRWAAWLYGAALICAAGCSGGLATPDDAGPGDGSTDASVDALCGAGLKPHGPACVPVLDDCKQGQVPVPGGGCKEVGIEPCSGGLKGPMEATCTPVGVVECSGGLKGPMEATCTPVGVETCSAGPAGLKGLKGPADPTCTSVGPPTTCLTGWAQIAKGWCEPVLPSGACAVGTMEVIGSATCQPIGDCGTGAYGTIQTDSKTLFVDQTYAGGGSDGTQAKPYTTLGDALQAAPSGAQIAVAAGTYQEDLAIKQPLTIEGRCAQKVVIKGQSSSAAAVEIQAKVTLRGLTVTGPGEGIRATGAEVLVERVAVQQCGALGILAHKSAKVTLRYALVQGNHGAGVELRGSTAALEHAVVRGTESDVTTKLGGEGILATAEGAASSTLTLGDCVIAGNRNNGVSIAGTTAIVDRTVISGTRPRAKDTTGGAGVKAAGAQAILTVRDGIVADNQHPGVSLLGAQATLERTVVRDTLSRDLDKTGGDGIQAIFDSAGPAKLTLKQCLLDSNHNIALVVAGSEATLERTAVQNTLPQGKDGKYGIGLQAGAWLAKEPQSTVSISECIFAGNSYEGIILFGARATLKRTVVHDTTYDAGVIAKAMGSLKADLTLSDCLVQGNRRVGVHVEGSKGLLERTVVKSTEAWTNKHYGVGLWAVGAEVTVRECLVTNNRQSGIVLTAAKATVERTVVKDTRCQLADSKAGYGIHAVDFSGTASELNVKGSLVSNNRDIGIALTGSTGIIERTVVRDTRSSALYGGQGDGIQILRGSQGPSRLILKECLVANNRNAGVSVYGSSAIIERTIVRETQSRDSDQKNVAGIEVRSWLKEASDLALRDSVVSKNRGTGVQVCGSTAKLERSVVRDTLPSALDGGRGHGVVARRLGDLSSKLTLEDCAVANNRSVGVAVLSSTATLDRTVVRDTQARADDSKLGIGIQASLLPDGSGSWTGAPSNMSLRNSLVSSNCSTGVSVASSNVEIQRSIVRGTRVDLSTGGYGDGIQASPHDKKDGGTLKITDSLVEDNARSGALYFRLGGSIQRTVLRRGVFAIVLEQGSL